MPRKFSRKKCHESVEIRTGSTTVFPELVGLPARYRPVRLLGRGGQGAVFEIRDLLRDGQPLALKVLHGDSPRAASIEALRTEFRLLSELAHPALARVHDFGTLDRSHGVYFTAELIRGTDLFRWFLNRPVSECWSEVRELCVQVLGGLGALHRSSCFHGDLKPSNLMVYRSPTLFEASVDAGRDRHAVRDTGAPTASCDRAGPRIKIIDFGAVRLLEAAATNGHRGAWSTPAYRPPGHFGGDDAQRDLYSFGLTLFHALTGRLPFEIGSPESRLEWERERRPLSLAESLEKTPSDLEELISGLTAATASRRLSDAREAVAVLSGGRSRRRGTFALTGADHLAGRSARLYGVESAIDSARRIFQGTSPSVFLISGPTGMGKTRLLDRLAMTMQVAGWKTAIVSAEDEARGWAELLSHVEGARWARPQPLHERGSDPLVVCELAEALADRRLFVGVDDWDRGSDEIRRLLASVLKHRDPPSSVAVAVTTRDPEAFRSYYRGSPIAACEEARLDGLDAIAARRLCADFFQTDQIPDDLARTAWRESLGHPGRLWSTLEELAGEGVLLDEQGFVVLPADWRDILRRTWKRGRSVRLGALELELVALWRALEGLPLGVDEARRVCEALAEGAQISGDLAALAGDPESWWSFVQNLALEGFLLRGRGIRYRLPVESPGSEAPTAAADDPASGSAAAEAVLRLVDRGELSPDSSDPDATVALARLSLRSGEVARAARFGRLAARQLRHRGHHVEAIELLERILRSSETSQGLAPSIREWLALRAGQLCRQVGDAARGLRLLRATSPRPDGDCGRRALLLRASFLDELGDRDAAIREAQWALQRVDRLQRSAGQVGRSPFPYQLAARLAAWSAACDRPQRCREHLARGRELRDALTDRRALLQIRGPIDEAGYVDALTRFGMVLSDRGERGEGVSMYNLARAVAKGVNRPDLQEDVLHELARLLALDGRFDEAEASFLECQRLAGRRGDRLAVLRAVANRATLRYKAGKLEDAERYFRRARTLSDSLGPNRCSAPILVGLEVLAREQGRLLEALRLLKRILRPPAGLATMTASPVRLNALFNLGEIYLALGRPERALQVREEALDQALRAGDRDATARAHVGVGAALYALGRLETARANFDRARSLTDPAALRWRATLHYYSGQLKLTRGSEELDAAAREFELAREMLEQTDVGAVAELALLGSVEVELRRGRNQAAASLLRQGADRGAHRRHRWLRLAHDRLVETDEEAEGRIDKCFAEARSAGLVWESLQICALVCRHVKGADREWSLRLEELLGRVARRSATLRVDTLRRMFLGEPAREGEESAGAGLTVSAPSGPEHAPGSTSTMTPVTSEAGAGLGELMRSWSEICRSGIADEKALEDQLERLRVAMGCRGLWIINDPGSQDPVAFSAHSCRDARVDVLVSGAAELEWVRQNGQPRVSSDRGLWPLAGLVASSRVRREQPRVLYAVWDPGSLADSPVASEVAGLAGVILRLYDLERGVLGERKIRQRREEEIRWLHARILEEKSQLETDALSREEFVKVRRQLGGGPGRAETAPLPVARSEVMQDILRRARQLASTTVPVLLTGEPGVGKDYWARLIHALGPRRDRLFLAQVCEIPESLLESELFGSVRGSFTGAERDRPGLLLSADGGTLYLDCVEDMPEPAQARLLRALETRSVRPVGSDESLGFDVRLIASTRLSLEDLRRRPGFRPDFFYRVQGDVLRIPTLRERRDDIPELFRQLLETFCEEAGIPIPEVDPRVEDLLRNAAWPGNVRELQNEIRRVLVERPLRITRRDFAAIAAPRPSRSGPVSGESGVVSDEKSPGAARDEVLTLQEARSRAERDVVIAALRHSRGNATSAARSLGVSRRHLGTLLSRYALNPLDFR